MVSNWCDGPAWRDDGECDTPAAGSQYKPILQSTRRNRWIPDPMPDEMFFTQDERSLRRGKRRDRRTETCRPCVLQTADGALHQLEGVVLDMNAHGLLVRTLETLPIGANVSIQLMRDDTFAEPISRTLTGHVVRRDNAGDGFTDHGVKLKESNIRRPERRPAFRIPAAPERPAAPARMHTFDMTVGDDWS